jgi:hypothetical protein
MEDCLFFQQYTGWEIQKLVDTKKEQSTRFEARSSNPRLDRSCEPTAMTNVVPIQRTLKGGCPKRPRLARQRHEPVLGLPRRSHAVTRHGHPPIDWVTPRSSLRLKKSVVKTTRSARQCLCAFQHCSVFPDVQDHHRCHCGVVCICGRVADSSITSTTSKGRTHSNSNTE